MDKIKLFLIKMVAKKYLVGGLATLYKKFEGNKTQISVVLCALVGIAQSLGYIPDYIATEIYKIIGTGGTLALLEKVNRYEKEFKEDIKK